MPTHNRNYFGIFLTLFCMDPPPLQKLNNFLHPMHIAKTAWSRGGCPIIYADHCRLIRFLKSLAKIMLPTKQTWLASPLTPVLCLSGLCTASVVWVVLICLLQLSDPGPCSTPCCILMIDNL